MAQSFNLLDQPWIPCEVPGGRVEEYSLRDALVYSHELRGISAESPLETASLYRLLLAALHRVFGPEDTDAWFALWQQGAWDAAALDAYFAQWYDRFDLLHPDEDRRFYQRRPPEGKGKGTPIIHLVHSTGNNATLFNHITDGNHAGLSFAEAARSVVTAQTFRVGGLLKPGVSGTDSPAGRGIAFFIEGNSLFEMLMLNFWPAHSQQFFQTTGIQQTGGDAPAWEVDDPVSGKQDRPAGYLDYLTWQGYCIWLETTGGSDRIYEVQVGIGRPKLSSYILDPFKHYRAIKKGRTNESGYTPLRFSESRALWRDSSTLLEQVTGPAERADRPPFPITWLSTLYGADDNRLLTDYPTVPVVALGMASDQARIDFYRHERLPLPAQYLSDKDLVKLLTLALRQAEDIRLILYRAIYRMAERIIAPDEGQTEVRKPRREDVNPLVNHWNADAQYWAALEPAFWTLLEDLPSQGEAALADWIVFLIQTARDVYASTESLAGTDTRTLKAAVAGKSRLEYGLKDIRKEIEQWQIV